MIFVNNLYHENHEHDCIFLTGLFREVGTVFCKVPGSKYPGACRLKTVSVATTSRASLGDAAVDNL